MTHLDPLFHRPCSNSVTTPAERRAALPIQIVLCGTSHPGNLGAVARAMKNMGLSQLVLVAATAVIDDVALATAKHAAEVLLNARHVADLPAALADSVAVWATTARPRELHLPIWRVRAAAEAIVTSSHAQTGLISIVFGAERTGLTNHELSWAQRVIEIPANPDYPVLNLGQAVQILAYELHVAQQAAPEPRDVVNEANPLATLAEWQSFEQRLADLLDQTPFFVRGATTPNDVADNRERLMSKLRILCRRAQPLSNELAIMQGMLRALATEPREPRLALTNKPAAGIQP